MGYIGKTPTPAALTASDITDGIISSAKIADGTITSADTDGTLGLPPFKNLVINGDMSIAQRGTSFTSDGYTLDRFDFDSTSSDGFTITQDSTVPSGQGFAKSLKVDCTTADTSLDTNDQIRVLHKVEAQNLQYLKYGTSSAQSITLSFWVRSNKTGTYGVSLSQEDRSFYTFIREYTISSADTWEKKTLTFDGDTSGVINNDNGAGLWVQFALGAGSNRQGTAGTWLTNYKLTTSNQVNLADSTSNEWYVTGVQLEAGTSASDFEFLPFDINQRRCQRYYFKTGGTSATAVGNASKNFMNVLVHAGTDARGQFFRPTMMRASPTFAANGSFQILGQINQTISSASDITLADGGGVSLNMSALTCELPSGSTAGHNGVCRANGDADAFFEFISEL